MFASPVRLGLDEFERGEHQFDALTYLYLNEDVRAEIGFDQAGAWRHWSTVGHAQGRFPPGLDRAAPRTIDRAAMAARPLGLNVIGPFEAISGLGTAARNLLAAIRQTGLPHDIHPIDVSTGHALITNAESAAPLRYRFNLVLANADQIRRVVGLYPDGAFDNAHTIAVWAWELASFRLDWHAAFALVDEVWTNSRFELDAIASVSPVPVHLVPLPIPDEPPADRTSARALFGLPPEAWVVLCAFDASSTEDRKNPFAAIRAFRDAFGLDPSRVLIVKHHGGDPALARRLREARSGAANIRLINARLTPGDHRALRSACDAFLSAHRSEGFGLNLAEFLHAGHAVVATDYSGSRDFLDAATGYPVPARLVEVGARTGPYLQHAVWAEPDKRALAASLREAALESGSRSRAARARIDSDFGVNSIANRILGRLDALEEARPLPASLTRFATLDPPHDPIAWPARLPMFALVTERPGPPSPTLLAQAYPFWELCAVLSDPPRPENAAGRATCRGDDPRVRLLRSDGTTTPPIIAAQATSAAWIVLTDDEQDLSPHALLSVALALDGDDPPALLVPLEAAGPSVVRKSALLAAYETGRSLDAILARIAATGRVARVSMQDAVTPEVAPVQSLADHAERIAALGLFDPEHYLVSSPDVSAAGIDPLMHYVEHGWREHRAPNFYFDPVWYRARHMRPADEDVDPLLHWERFRNSGVRPSRHFDPAWVRRSRHLPPGRDPLQYFLERRCHEDISPLPEFDPAWYRARRRDIAYRKVDPFEHYMRFGAVEGVNPSADFDTRFYAARHMRGLAKRDPVASNPLLHYLEHRDTQPAVTSLKAALRQEVSRLRLLGRSFIEMSFCWFDGLPQRIDALRTYLADPTLPMPFLLVFANRLLETASRDAGDDRTAEACLLPLTDDYDDPDICARLVECFADPRCLRRGGKPILAIIKGDDPGLTSSFAERLAGRLSAEHGLQPMIEFLD